MKVLYLTTGATGSGRLVRGISIGNAFRRKEIEYDYTILSGSQFSYLADSLNIKHLVIPLEDVERFSKKEYQNTIFYQTLVSQNPDVIIVDLIWFTLHNFINELECKKIFLCRQVDDSFFSIDFPDNPISFQPENYDRVLSIEPFNSSFPMETINPIVLRNRDEILSRDNAISELKLDPDREICILSYSGHPGDFKRVKKTYSHLEDLYQMVYTTTYEEGIFPVIDYYNASDLIICGAGYNSFWEVIYLNKEAIFVPTHAIFESGERRIHECQEYNFDENGADQLVDIIMNLYNQTA